MSSDVRQDRPRRSTEEQRYELLRALRWLRSRPELSRDARSSLEKPDLVFADAVIEDPRRILTAARAVVDGAKREGAPEHVLKALTDATERLEAGTHRLERLDYTLKAVARLRGMRDRFEIEPELERALADAPDDVNRQKISTMLRGIRRPPGHDLGFPGGVFGEDDDDDDDGCDWLCCGFTCVLCLEACIVCCGLACLFC